MTATARTNLGRNARKVTAFKSKPVVRVTARTEQSSWQKLFADDRVKRQDLIAFSRELATLLEAGIGISPALELLAEQRKHTPFEPVIRALQRDLNSGLTIGGAMAKHPKIFPHIYVRSVATADRGAPLAPTLMRSVSFLDAAQSAVSQAKRAMIYPAVVITVGIGVVFMLLTVSLPQMVGLFSNLGAELPLPTRVLLAVSAFLKADGKYVFPLLALAVLLGIKALQRPRGKLWMHRMLLRAPVLSGVIIQSDMARISSSLAALSEAGLSLPEALDVAKDTVSNEVIRNALIETQRGLMAGEGLARPLGRSGLFPQTFVQTLRVAEDTGTLDANLRRMGEMYSKEASERVKTMASLVEPLATVVVAVGVGAIALSVIMPMYSALGALDK
jgi:type IV pilus assembly protein PilC